MESFHPRLTESLPEGQSKLTLFRPPYGQRNAELLQALERGGLKNILWNIDSQDWHASTTGTKAAGRVLSLMLLWRHGTILFHDIHPKAPQALPAHLAPDARLGRELGGLPRGVGLFQRPDSGLSGVAEALGSGASVPKSRSHRSV